MASLIDTYYGAWRDGASEFDEAALTKVLDPDLDFEGPIAGKRRGALGFISGLRRFASGLSEPITVLQRLEDASGAAVMYDAALPGGTLRFAEFLELGGDRITAVRLVYDAGRYVALGGS